jgi:CBS domain-containing membrane protein
MVPPVPDNPAEAGVEEIELTDADILDAMRHIPGYLDITTDDFREIYHLAWYHALQRLFCDLTAGRLMRTGVPVLDPDTTLDHAIKAMADSGYKGLPVTDGDGRVIGMLTETDFLRRLKAKNFPDLLLRMLDSSFELVHRCHETPVRAAMTQPPVTVGEDAGFVKIVAAFERHEGRSMPVLNAEGRFAGLLLRKDFVASTHLKIATQHPKYL